ncbi:MAG: type II toxin-antitoxin system Phd/YefM family antitoxin [Gammaproteobacteria bacterium]|jgi:PHD/YefM family antitoxin component YafN of YafNO toxin-antitoxin module
MKRSSKAPRIRHLPITKARINLGAVVKNIHLNKEYVILEKDGIPIAAIMDVEEFEDYLEVQDPRAKRIIAESRQESLAGKTRDARLLLTELEAEDEKDRKKTRKEAARRQTA